MPQQYLGRLRATCIVGLTLSWASAAGFAEPCTLIVEPLGSGVSGPVRDMASVRRGDVRQLYIVGKFASAGGTIANNIAMWDGEKWNAYRFLPFEPPTFGVPGSRGLSVLEPIPNPFDPNSNDEFIMVGGDLLLGESDAVRVFFPMEASITGSPIAAYDSEVAGFGITDIAFGSLDSGERIVLGGDFQAIDGQPIERIAQRGPDLQLDRAMG